MSPQRDSASGQQPDGDGVDALWQAIKESTTARPAPEFGALRRLGALAGVAHTPAYFLAEVVADQRR